MRLTRTLGVGLLGVVVGGVGARGWAQGTQSEDVSSACTLKNDQYTCDKGKFEQIFGPAKTVAIETAPTDAVAQNALKKLVAQSGKTLVDRGAHPDITFLLVPPDQNGVQYTSNQSVLAALRVYAADPQKAGRGDLVWAENFMGEADTPWGLSVSRVTGQFKARFVPKR